MEQNTIEYTPTENAKKILESRYLLKDLKGALLESPNGMMKRVAKAVANAEEESLRNEYYEKFYSILASKKFMPNSPTLMNAGTDVEMCSACFVLPVEDNMNSILDAVKNTGIIFKTGGGVGINFSNIRPKNSYINTTGGNSSGPLSFMQIFDILTKVIAQGGKRRGALMGILNVDHPDILDFIKIKEKAKVLTGFNLSIGITDTFIETYKNVPNSKHKVIDPKTKEESYLLNEKGIHVTVEDVFNLISKKAWESGEPGIVFIDRLQEFNTTPSLKINATNPCLISSTLVSTPTGYRRVDSVKEGDRIDTVLGTGLVDKIEVHDNVPVYEVEFTDGGRVTATEAHQFHAIKVGTKKHCNKFDCIKLNDLNIGDWVRVFPTSLPNNKLNYVCKNSMSEFKYGVLLGILLGDGCLSPKTISRNIVKIAYNKKDEDWKKVLDNLIAPIVEEIFFDESKTSNSANLCVCRKDSTLLKIIKEEGIISKSNERRIPKRLLNSNENILKGLISGLFSTDGNVNMSASNPQIRYTTASRKLICDIRNVLLMFGIHCSMYEKNSPSKIDGRVIKNNPRYEISFSGTSIRTFYEKIGFVRYTKQSKLINLVNNYSLTGNLWRTRIKKITYKGNEKVYDLHEPKSDTWITNGYVSRGCGETPLPPYGSCSLGSINVSKFATKVLNGTRYIDYDSLGETVKLGIRFLDNTISINKFPLPEIEKVAKSIRNVGLGVMGFADLLFLLNIPYDSDEALLLAQDLMKYINTTAHEYSEELGKTKGDFNLFCDSTLWKDYSNHRNSTCTVIAPTGTISKIADCSGGIEPLFSPVFIHNILNRNNMLEISPVLKNRLKEFDIELSKDELDQMHKEGSIQNINRIPEEVKKVFKFAQEINPDWHIKMQEVFQKYTDCSVSKTINLPNKATIEDVKWIYKQAFYSNILKGITTYRDGSRLDQPMQLKDYGKNNNGNNKFNKFIDVINKNKNINLAVKMKQNTPFGTLHITLVLDENLNEKEVFAQLGKSGEVVGADLEAICRLSSHLLKNGFKLDKLIKQLINIGTSLAIPTETGKVVSLPDGLAKGLSSYREVKLEVSDKEEDSLVVNRNFAKSYVLKCPECEEGRLIFEEGCTHCDSCGYSAC